MTIPNAALSDYTQRCTVTISMISALRSAAKRVILMFQLSEMQSHKTASTNDTWGGAEKGQPKRTWTDILCDPLARNPRLAIPRYTLNEVLGVHVGENDFFFFFFFSGALLCVIYLFCLVPIVRCVKTQCPCDVSFDLIALRWQKK